MEYITREDLRVINAALQKGEVVRIKHTREGTKITRESSRLLKSKPIIRKDG